MRSVRSLVSFAVVAAALCSPLLARAADGHVVVELRDGSILRGAIVEKVPGKKVVVQLATGEVRTLDWDTLAKIDEAAGPAPQPSPPAAAAAEGVVVHLDADDPRATLQRRAGTSAFVISGPRGSATAEGEAWEDLCVMPCDQRVQKNQTVRIAGDGVTPSSNFTISRTT